MTTPLDIIKLSLKDIGVLGVGQSALAEDTNDAFTTLNQMIGQWRRKRWVVYQLVDTGVTSTGAQFYTVGAGGDFDIPRPDKLEYAFFRQLVQSQPNQIDYPLEQLFAYEDYANIALKQLQSFPSYFFYDPGYPLGKFYPWPVAQSAIYALHIITKRDLPNFTSLTQSILLPDEYLAALRYNLDIKLSVQYNRQINPSIMAMAKDGLNVVRGANTAIARLTLPTTILRPGIYNPYSDQIR